MAVAIFCFLHDAPEKKMSPLRLWLVILASPLLSGPTLARGAQLPSTTVLYRNARQVHAIVDRDFRPSPHYAELSQAAERIARRAEFIRSHFGHPSVQPLIRQSLIELESSITELEQILKRPPSQTAVYTQPASYAGRGSVHVVSASSESRYQMPVYRAQAAIEPRVITRLENALHEADTAANDFSCALGVWEQTMLWDFGGWDRARPGTSLQHQYGPKAQWGLSDARQSAQR